MHELSSEWEYGSGSVLFLGHVGILAVLTGHGGTRQIGLQSKATELQSSGREEWAMGTLDAIVEEEKLLTVSD